jgi:ParB family chromosome partitioning protein
MVKKYKKDNTIETPKKEADEMPKFIKKGIRDFSEYFGHKVDVKVGANGKGKITIPFHSEQDFTRIKKLLKSSGK